MSVLFLSFSYFSICNSNVATCFLPFAVYAYFAQSPKTCAHLFEAFLADGFGIQFDRLSDAVRQVHNAPHVKGCFWFDFVDSLVESKQKQTKNQQTNKQKVKAVCGFCCCCCFWFFVILSFFCASAAVAALLLSCFRVTKTRKPIPSP